ncbi:DUF4158 domain-containing protein [Saccharopolyspora pogona]|uniref:DUF4158 domain-containing protein n=1 Tax=Saccharopolyspora pogona TaxID=333966 RepID=UPI001CC22EF0
MPVLTGTDTHDRRPSGHHGAAPAEIIIFGLRRGVVTVGFLSDEGAARCGAFPGELSRAEFERYFFLDDADREAVQSRRRPHNRLRFAMQSWRRYRSQVRARRCGTGRSHAGSRGRCVRLAWSSASPSSAARPVRPARGHAGRRSSRRELMPLGRQNRGPGGPARRVGNGGSPRTVC